MNAEVGAHDLEVLLIYLYLSTLFGNGICLKSSSGWQKVLRIAPPQTLEKISSREVEKRAGALEAGAIFGRFSTTWNKNVHGNSQIFWVGCVYKDEHALFCLSVSISIYKSVLAICHVFFGKTDTFESFKTDNFLFWLNNLVKNVVLKDNLFFLFFLFVR